MQREHSCSTHEDKWDGVHAPFNFQQTTSLQWSGNGSPSSLPLLHPASSFLTGPAHFFLRWTGWMMLHDKGMPRAQSLRVYKSFDPMDYSHPRLLHPCDFQARIVESCHFLLKESFRPRDRTPSPAFASRFFTTRATYGPTRIQLLKRAFCIRRSLSVPWFTASKPMSVLVSCPKSIQIRPSPQNPPEFETY